jgi:hypothetical protein
MSDNNSTPARKSVWQDALAWLQRLHPALLMEMPKELPPEEATDFWPSAARLEMTLRKDVTLRVEGFISGDFSNVSDPAISWLLHRRLEWAAQIIFEAALRDPFPGISLEEALRWSTIESWDSDGCIGFWNHAVERGGALPSEDPLGIAHLMKGEK